MRPNHTQLTIAQHEQLKKLEQLEQKAVEQLETRIDKIRQGLYRHQLGIEPLPENARTKLVSQMIEINDQLLTLRPLCGHPSTVDERYTGISQKDNVGTVGEEQFQTQPASANGTYRLFGPGRLFEQWTPKEPAKPLQTNTRPNAFTFVRANARPNAGTYVRINGRPKVITNHSVVSSLVIPSASTI